MATVILICGKLCSGKSRYARALREKCSAVILSTDEVTWDLTDNAQGEGYPAFAARVNAYLLKKAAEIALAGANVILDWGFWTRADRAAASAYLRGRGVDIAWHCVDVSDARWRRNIESRNRRVLAGEGGSDFYVDEGLMRKTTALFELPDRDEMDVWYSPDTPEEENA